MNVLEILIWHQSVCDDSIVFINFDLWQLSKLNAIDNDLGMLQRERLFDEEVVVMDLQTNDI